MLKSPSGFRAVVYAARRGRACIRVVRVRALRACITDPRCACAAERTREA